MVLVAVMSTPSKPVQYGSNILGQNTRLGIAVFVYVYERVVVTICAHARAFDVTIFVCMYERVLLLCVYLCVCRPAYLPPRSTITATQPPCIDDDAAIRAQNDPRAQTCCDVSAS